MRKIISKIAGTLLGLSLAVGVGVFVSRGGVAEKVNASNYQLVPYTIAHSDKPANYSNNYDKATEGLECNGIAWHFEGNTSLSAEPLWRIGGKAANTGSRSIYNLDPLGIEVRTINYTRNGYSNGSSSSITVNSITLTVASDADFSSVLDTIVIENPEIKGTGTYVFSPSESSYWASNSYYRFVLDLTLTGTKNSYVGFGGLEFVENTGGEITTCDVNFYSNGTKINTVQVNSGSAISAPTAPSRDGYTFGGWYTDDGTFQNAYDFTSVVESDLDLYAKWTENEQPVDDDSLVFDLTKNPGGWPTTNSTTLTDYSYTLDEVGYTFKLKNVKQNSGYLMLTKVAVLGLPSIEGKKLTKVVAENSNGCSTSTKVGISDSSTSESYIAGGAIQTWSKTGSSYTYELTDTEVETVYYLYVTSANAQLITLRLLYEDSGSVVGTKIQLAASDVTMELDDAAFAPEIKNAADLAQTISGCEFSSSDTAVVSISDGKVTPQGAGTATITVTHADDTSDPSNPITYKSTTFSVTVIEVESIESIVKACKDLGSTADLAGTHTIKGTVTGNYSSTSKKNYMIQQGDYGMYLYDTGVDLNVGEVVRATGTFCRYKNWFEGKSFTSVVKLSEPAESISSPVISSISDLTDEYQNRVVTFKGLSYVDGTPGESDTSITFSLGGSNIILRTTAGIAEAANINAKLNEVKNHKDDSTFNLVGVHYTVYNSDKQFKVDNASKIQIVAKEATVTELVQGFVDTCMHLEDIPVSEESRASDSNACSVTGGYYEVAKAALTALGEEAIAEFKGNDIFNDAQERYESWAEIYGDATPYAAEVTPIAGSARYIATNSMSSASTIIIVVVALTSITSIGVLIVIKRKRSLVK